MANICKLFLEMTVLASVMIVAVWGLRALFSKKISPAVILMLWIAVLLRLCIPLTLDTPLHVGDLWPERLAAVQEMQPVESAAMPDTHDEIVPVDYTVTAGVSPETTGIRIPPDTGTQAEPDMGRNVRTPAKKIPVWRVLAGIWVLGIACVLLLTLQKAFSFKRRLLVCRRIEDSTILDIVDTHKQRLGIRRKITVLECDCVDTPSIFGFFRPYLLLPAAFVGNVDKSRIGHILLHELCHVKRKDVLAGYLWLAAKLLHWFNPLVWLAYRLYRDDVELCCDQMVIRYLGEDDRYEYSRTLIDVIRVTKKCGAIATAVAFCENEEKLKERVVRMVSPRKRSRFAFAVSVLLALTMIVACFTTACRKKADGNMMIIDPAKDTIVYSDGYVDGQDSQYWYVNETYPENLMVDTGDGYYFMGGECCGFLYYMDKSTGEAAPVCNKDGCDHRFDPNHGCECNAYFGMYDAKAIIYYMGKLYVLGADWGDDTIYEISPDGAAPRELKQLTKSRSVTSIAFHRGYVYYMEEYTGGEVQDTQPREIELFRFPINDMDAEPELVYTVTGLRPSFGKLLCYGNYVFFMEHRYSDESMNYSVIQMNRYNIKTGKMEIILDDNVGGQYTIFNGKLAYFAQNGTCLCDLDGKNSKRISDRSGVMSPGGKYLLIDNVFQTLSSSSAKRTVYAYDTDGNFAGSVQLDDWGRYPLPVGVVDGLYIAPTRDTDMDLTTVYSMPVDKIADGTAVPEVFIGDTAFR